MHAEELLHEVQGRMGGKALRILPPSRMLLDEKKRQLCAKEGIEEIVIHNQEVMDYEYISDFILDLFRVKKISV